MFIAKKIPAFLESQVFCHCANRENLGGREVRDGWVSVGFGG